MNYKDDYVLAENLETNVITITFSSLEPDDKIFDNYLNLLDEIYAKKKKVILVYESTNAKYLSSAHRIKLGKWFKSNSSVVKEYNHHTIFIINSVMIRMVLNGIFLVEKPVYKYDIVGTMGEAEKIVAEKLKSI